MFNSRYPIVCSPMNEVSDLKLALACINAGIVPSLIAYPDLDIFFDDIKTCKEQGNEIFAAIDLADLIRDDVFKRILESGITHIELIEYSRDQLSDANIQKIRLLRSNNIKIYIKILLHNHIIYFLEIIDGIIIKGPEGAGRSVDGIDLISEIREIKLRYNHLEVIASGGIKSKDDIDRLLAAGADAVSIGTMFALTEESSMPLETKQKLLGKKVSDITRTQQGANQRAIVFDAVGEDDFNNTSGLVSGLKTGSHGHIFVGNAIEAITKIESVADVVKRLTNVR